MSEVTLLNTGLPTVITGALGLALPYLFVSAEERSHRRIALRVGVSGIIVLGVSAGLMAWSYGSYGIDVKAALAASPTDTILYFARRGALMAMVWLPLLLLAWFGLAQRVERLRSRDIIRGSAQ